METILGNNCGTFRLRAKKGTGDGSFSKYSDEGFSFLFSNGQTGGDVTANTVNLSLSHNQLVGAAMMAGMPFEDAKRFCGGSWRQYFDVVERVGDWDSQLESKHKATFAEASMANVTKSSKKEDKLNNAEKEAKEARNKEKQEKTGCCANSISNMIYDCLPEPIKCVLSCFY